MIRAYMTEEEILKEAETCWIGLSHGGEVESITYDGGRYTYTYESVLADTRRLAEAENQIDQRAKEMLQDAIENNDFFKSLVDDVKNGKSFSDAAWKIKEGVFEYTKTLDKNEDGIEVSAAGLFYKASSEYFKMIAKARDNVR